ncbi:MAG: membrane protein insertase YidC [Rhodospirillaceae bacterium]|nr:membrane protein insertase YidC [Rhodospirillaceae bacterium]
MADQKNIVLAVVLSLIILIGWEVFFAPKPVPQAPADVAAVTAAMPAAPGSLSDGSVPATGDVSAVPTPVPAIESPRVSIETPHIKGSLSLTGSRFDDITLLKYRETIDPKSPPIDLLSPASAAKPYYVELGWLSGDAALALPSATTTWTPRDPDASLTDTQPVVLTWDNGAGLRFTKTIRADKDYMFSIEQSVENYGTQAATIYPYGLTARVDTPPIQDFFILHEGPLGVFDGVLKEMDYSELQKEQRFTTPSTGGWAGFTDKYWLTALAFDQSMKVDASFNHAVVNGRDRYQTDLRGAAITIAPQETKTIKSFVFAGAKEVQLLDSYAETLGIAQFDLAIDFGWFYFLTKPFFYILIWMKETLGNFGLAILGLTVLLRLLMFPLANKQFAAMSKLKKLQPEMQKLQQRHADDRVKLNQEMMDLYKREKANPLAGCLPILIQIPIFFALYKVLFVTIEMRHAPFYGWIHDLSAPDPTSLFNLFGLLPFGVPSFLMIGAWPVIMGITMYLQQKLNPQPADPIQAKVFMVLPFMFTFLLASFPAGLVIYWAWSNVLGILQQWVIMRRMGVSV